MSVGGGLPELEALDVRPAIQTLYKHNIREFFAQAGLLEALNDQADVAQRTVAPPPWRHRLVSYMPS